ncbi:hypothetical protein OC861_004012 [Tilletia horrida]|nr:hypothetical protein OC861_004012 [Tilletia horrida]
MRIDVRLPLPAASGSSAGANSEITCPQIAKLAGTGELILVELQGSLELEGLDPSTSQMIGTLTFEGPQADKPVLLVSHHRLYGKFVDLHQPLAVLQKFSREPPASIDRSPSAKRRWLEQPWTSDLESGDDDDDEEEEGKGDGDHRLDGLTSRRKRAKRAEGVDGVPASSSPAPPDSSPCRTQNKDGKGNASADSPSKSKAAANPEALGAMHAADNDDWNDDEDDDDDGDDEGGDEDGPDAADDSTATARPLKRRRHARQPRVWYDVVCLIKRKILFAKRPEPVVNLASEEGVAQRIGSQVAAVKATS